MARQASQNGKYPDKQSVKEFQGFWDISTSLMCITDFEGIFKRVNPSWEKVLGYSEAELTGKPFQDFIHPQDVAPSLARLQKITTEKRSVSFENRLRDKDGSYHCFNWNSAFIEHENLVYSIGIDISPLKQQEDLHKLLLEQTELEATLRQLPVGMIIADASGKLTFSNDRAIEIWRRDFNNCNSVSEYGVFKCFHTDGTLYKPEEWPLARSLMNGEMVDFEEMNFERGDGSHGIIRASSRPISNSQGQIVKAVMTFRDITDIKQLEDELRLSEEKYRNIIETAYEGIMVTNAEGRITFTNHRRAEMLGYVPEEMLGKHTWDFVHDDQRADIKAKWAQRQQGFSDRYELKMRHKDGSAVWFFSSVSPLFDDSKQFQGILSMSIDITERKKAEEDLRQSESRFRTLFAYSPIGIELYDDEGRLVLSNTAALNIFGIRFSDAQFHNLFNERGVTSEIAGKLKNGEPVRFETAFDFSRAEEQTAKSGIAYLDIHITPLFMVREGTLFGYLVHISDITERKKTEDELGKYREHLESVVEDRTKQLEKEIVKRSRAEEELRHLSQRIIQLQEEERRTISRELHDQTGQSLTVLSLVLGKIRRQLPENATPDFEQAQQTLRDVVSQIRNLSLTLHPSMLDDVGLVPTLVWYFQDWENHTGMHVDFHQSGMDNKLSPDVNLTAYRIIQESLTNVARHAGVKKVTVRTVIDGSKLILKIEDKGKGFNPAKVPIAHSGIRGIEERIRPIGGRLTVKSKPGEGTQINVEIPLIH